MLRTSASINDGIVDFVLINYGKIPKELKPLVGHKISMGIDEYIEFIYINSIKTYVYDLTINGSEFTYHLLNNGWVYNNNLTKDKPKEWNKVAVNGSVYSIDLQVKDKQLRIVDVCKILPNISIDELRTQFIDTKEKEDLNVVARSVAIMLENGYFKDTISSNALSTYKTMLKDKMGISFESVFPKLSINIDDFVRKSYNGGWNFLNKKNMGYTGEGQTFDNNGLYSSVMYNQPMPIGYPVHFKGEYVTDKKYPLYIVTCEIDFLTLKENKYPMATTDNTQTLSGKDYITLGKDLTMTLTSVDLELLKECYNISGLKMVEGYKFQSSTALFKDYIDYYKEMKEDNTGAKYHTAKRFLNALYGRFGTNPRRYETNYSLENGEEVKTRTNSLMRRLVGKEKHLVTYTAVSSFTCSYGRAVTVRGANSNYKRFVYGDTDSLHVTGLETPKGIEVHKSKLGCWKLEKTFTECKFLQRKCYAEKDENGWEYTISGFPKVSKSQIKDISQFNFNEKFMVKQKKTVKGKSERVDVEFTIQSSLNRMN